MLILLFLFFCVFKYKKIIKNYLKRTEKIKGLKLNQKNKGIKTEIQNKKLYILKLDKKKFNSSHRTRVHGSLSKTLTQKESFCSFTVDIHSLALFIGHLSQCFAGARPSFFSAYEQCINEKTPRKRQKTPPLSGAPR